MLASMHALQQLTCSLLTGLISPLASHNCKWLKWKQDYIEL